MPIHYDSVTKESTILSPIKNFQPDTQLIEHRRDPLTGRGVMVLKGRGEYVRRFIESDDSFIRDFASSTEKDCPFCPASVTVKSPKFTADISAEGRIQVGEAICFPSLFSHNDHNAIVVPTKRHRVALNEFSVPILVDALMACVQYLGRVHSQHSGARYAAIIMNFLPPAGSTIAHTHLQALASGVPFESLATSIKASGDYFEKNRSSYWHDLIESERRLDERYLGKIGNVHWLTPYAPLGLNDVQAIIPGKSSVDQLSDDDLQSLAEGLTRVLRFYHEMGIRSFNAAIYSGPLGERLDYFDLGLHVVSRFGYKPRFVSDVWALQYLLGDVEIYGSPEETCTKLQPFFRVSTS